MRLHAVLAVAMLVSPAAVRTQAPTCPARPGLDSALLMSDVFRLADDSMRGRRIGTPENIEARDFIASRFDDLALAPVGGVRLAPFIVTGRQAGTVVRGTNVLGMIRGSSAPNEYIVISAHFDHLGVRATLGGDSIYNGADDNASGTAALLNLAKHFAQNPPRHSIIFAAFDGEESGDVGSRAWVDSLPVPVASVLLDVNMDMVGRNEKNQLYTTGVAKYPFLRSLIEEQVACTPAPYVLTIGHDGGSSGEDWTDQSDQGAFHRKGIPFIYFGEEDHPDYHRATDHADRLMPGFYVNAARTVASFVMRFDAAPARKPAN